MTRPKRAFSLVIVIVLGVAAFVIASTLIAVSESAGTRVAHSVQGDRAAAIAEAGMERARSYVQAVTASAVDYDLVLDPDNEANCSGLPTSPATVAAGSQALRPKLSDGTLVTYRGKDWTRVAYDDGAYLIRFEDDADDFRTQTPGWDDYTSNTLGATNCVEGPTALGTADNPLRDRNQTISITVIGIAPGTDPDRAVHRATLRRMETFPGLAQVAGIQVRGNVNVAGNADLRACSPIASMQIDGNLSGDGSGTGCACGESRADSVSTEWSHCTASTVCTAPVAIGCQAGTMGTPGPSVPAVLDFRSDPGTDFYFDFAAPDTSATPRQGSCIFRIENNTLWWWDPEAVRGGVRCSTKEGAGGDLPDIKPDDSSNFQQCWTPIVGNIGGTLRGLDPLEVTGSQWRPRNVAITGITAATANTVTGTSPTFPGAVTFRKPNWEVCQLIDHPADVTPRGCTTCDGTVTAMEGSPLWFAGDTAAQLNAIPAGIYIFDGDISVSGAGQAMNAPTGGGVGQINTATFTPSQWPLMTIATAGNINLNTRTILGISGRGDAAWPAIITNGTIDIQSGNDMFIGGSVWGLGNWFWRGNTDNFFFGELHLNGNWDMAGSSTFFWNYRFPLSGAQILPTPTAPTQSRSLD